MAFISMLFKFGDLSLDLMGLSSSYVTYSLSVLSTYSFSNTLGLDVQSVFLHKSIYHLNVVLSYLEYLMDSMYS